MTPLHIATLPFQEADLLTWRHACFDILQRSQASLFIKNILVRKAERRHGRRFFGEAFVAAKVDHEQGWYGSFKWLTSTPSSRNKSEFAEAFGAALAEHFPSAASLPSKALALGRVLDGKRPVAPDLWLIVNGQHRFIEVKLPGDTIHKTQLAGLALISTYLSKDNDVSVWVYDLYPEGGQPGLSSAALGPIRDDYERFCRELRSRPRR